MRHVHSAAHCTSLEALKPLENLELVCSSSRFSLTLPQERLQPEPNQAWHVDRLSLQRSISSLPLQQPAPSYAHYQTAIYLFHSCAWVLRSSEDLPTYLPWHYWCKSYPTAMASSNKQPDASELPRSNIMEGSTSPRVPAKGSSSPYQARYYLPNPCAYPCCSHYSCCVSGPRDQLVFGLLAKRCT